MTVNTSRHVTATESSSGFTLIELVVVLFIVSILASLSLAGLAGARQRGKIDKTRSTIRKLHELIVPQYESYLRRRVPAGSPLERLVKIRTLQLYEMPDSWGDVPTQSGTINDTLIPSFAWASSRVQAYASYKQALAATLEVESFPSHECLYMVAALGSGEPDALSQFRSDEIGDSDDDKAPEFIDGWGSPIAFVRWPAGAHLLTPPSAIQIPDHTTHPDPFDPMRKDTGLGYALTPLIVSAGSDEQGNIEVTPDAGWTSIATSSFGLKSLTDYDPPEVSYAWGWPRLLGGPNDHTSDADYDNITNHNLFSK